MKKIIFITICLLLIISKVEAKEVYYSDYSSYSDFTTEPLISNELNEVNIETRYKFYKEERTNEEYSLLNQNRLYDLNDYIYTDYTDWGNSENVEGAEYEYQTLYHYQEMEEVRYIYFDNIYGSNEVLRLAEIKAFANNVQIPYEFHCTGCRNYTYSKITDGITEQNEAYVINDQRMYLDLLKTYPVDSLKIELYLYDITTETKTYAMHITRVTDGEAFYSKKFYQNFQNDDFSTIFPFTHTYKDLNVGNPLWKDWQISLEPVTTTDVRRVYIEIRSRYRFKLYKHYDLVRNYLDDYYLEQENYIKDENQSKKFYQKRTRDKLEIEDLKVTDLNTKIEDLIISTTDYDIIGNVDYETNGNYEVQIKTPYITIDKNVEIDIYENKLKELEQEVQKEQEEKESLLDQNTNIQKELENINIELNNKKEELNKLDSSYKEQIDNYEKTIKENNNAASLSLEQAQVAHNIEKNNLNSQIENYISTINQLNYQIDKNNSNYKKVVQEYKNSINEYQNELAKKTIKEETITSSVGSSKKSVILLIFVIIVLLIRNIRLNHRNM